MKLRSRGPLYTEALITLIGLDEGPFELASTGSILASDHRVYQSGHQFAQFIADQLQCPLIIEENRSLHKDLSSFIRESLSDQQHGAESALKDKDPPLPIKSLTVNPHVLTQNQLNLHRSLGLWSGQIKLPMAQWIANLWLVGWVAHILTWMLMTSVH